MLTPEQARDGLLAAGGPAQIEQQVRRVRRLDGELGKVARALVVHHLPPNERAWMDNAILGRRLDEMSEGRRAKVFKALHPKLAALFEHAWTDLVADPYPYAYAYGEARRPFRAQAAPELSRRTRAAWLSSVVYSTGAFDRDVRWFAAWAGHIQGGMPHVGRLLGVAIDAGDRAVLDTLLATARGDHEVAQMGRHVPAALLSCGEPAAWEQIERLLLAAQRQEGLRQIILETVDFAHPDAFRRMLRLILDEGLTRFAGVIRAVGLWFGAAFDVRDRKIVDELLEQVDGFLSDDSARVAALGSDDPGRVYLALWSGAYRDAATATEEAIGLLRDPSPERRLAAARILDEVQLPRAASALAGKLRDDDLRVVAIALRTVTEGGWNFGGAALELLQRLLDRLGKETTVPLGLWKPEDATITAAGVADAMVWQLGDRPPTDLRPVLDRMSPSGRANYARLLARHPRRYRKELLDLTGDRSESVRSTAFEELAKLEPPAAEEALRLEQLLQRKSTALRRSVLQVLLTQDDHAAAATAERLLAGNAAQKTAGIELLTVLKENGRAETHVPRLVEAVARDGSIPAADRASVQGQFTDTMQRRFEDLLNHTARTVPVQPRAPDVDVTQWHPGIVRVLRSLDAWLAEHRDVEVPYEGWRGTQYQLVSNLGSLSHPAPKPWEAQAQRFPFPEFVQPWWERTAPQLTDGGVEVLLAWPAAETELTAVRQRQMAQYERAVQQPSWMLDVVRDATPSEAFPALQYTPVTFGFITWFAMRELRPSWIDALLDVGDHVLSAVPVTAIDELPTVAQLMRRRWGRGTDDAFDWRVDPLTTWLTVARIAEAVHSQMWSSSQRARLWAQARFVDEPWGLHIPSPEARDEVERAQLIPGERSDVPRRPARRSPPLELAARAVDDGIATHADIVDLLIGERTREDRVAGGSGAAQLFSELTRRRRPDWLGDHPWLAELVGDIRRRVVDIELDRGDLPTPVTTAALQLRAVFGCEIVVRLLAGLAGQMLVRGYIWHGDSKPEVFSKLIRASFPAESETHEDFTAAVARYGVQDQRLVELAVYAPQWAPFVEVALGWGGMTDAVYWLHAHTKDRQWQVDSDIREEWEAQTHQRTPLSAQDLVDGAVDVAWLQRVVEELGDDRFNTLLKAAKYASSSGGHKRAELFADAVRGRVGKRELLERIRAKRHQDAVRALGLLPLPRDDKKRRADLLSRYEALNEWQRGGSKFGQQRRASEGLAVRVAMDNLARNAGYRDPQRLQWAMEAEAVRDLAAGAVSVTEDDVTVSLSIDAEGAPQLEVVRGDRPLKNIPPKVAKREPVAALKERATALRDQSRRMRASLEEASVRGDRFTPDEFGALCGHPVLAPMLERLLVTTDDGVLGLPRDSGRTLVDATGSALSTDSSEIRLVHPTDLLASGNWHAWQRRCFEERLRQPFKQVFRELYVPTAAELDDDTAVSGRYTGHQIQARQATALFGARGWVVDRESGALRTFHDEGLTVHVSVLGLWGTPGDVEDPTIDAIMFAPVGQWRPIKIRDVPLRLFSEAMRDIDLVVSVAHAGGVDPEASASTVEMRAVLVRETADMLALDNVELTEHHAMIKGKLGSYSVHLGSGTVHRRPGNALCIVPVGAQHRGRIFLPFADDDPRTAEVVSKVVMLARDDKIKDPTVLEQLRV